MTPTIRRVDWRALIEGLVERGYANYSDLAADLDIARKTLSHWRDGGVPPHHYGEALVKIWECATGSPAPEFHAELAPI